MFWMLPQALKGRLNVATAFWGVTIVGSFLVGMMVFVPLALFEPKSLPLAKHLFLLQYAFIALASIGLWRCSKNALRLWVLWLVRMLAAFYFHCAVWLSVATVWPTFVLP